MADNTKISWADATWQVTHGCEKIATGCRGCYAIRDVHRMAHNPNPKISEPRKGLVHKLAPHPDSATKFKPFLDWTGVVRTAPENLSQPLRWKKPRRIFVNSNSDLFHKDVPFEFIAAVWGVMAATPWHRYMVLTKRIDRAREFFKWFYHDYEAMGKAHVALVRYLPDSDFDPEWVMDEDEPRKPGDVATYAILESVDWDSPLPNVELYVSGATQADVDANVPVLLDCPAAFRGLSLEPQVERVDVSPWLQPSGYEFDPDVSRELGAEVDTPTLPALDIVIQGGESGPNARPFDIAWARYTHDQCREAGVLYHLKQLGANIHDVNFAGWDATSHRYTDDPENGELAGKPVNPTAWPDHIADEDRVEHDINGFREEYQGAPVRVRTRHRAGADPSEWPEDLRNCRDLPKMEVAGA